MLASVVFLLGLALLVAGVFGLAGTWWALLAAGVALVGTAVLISRGEGRS